VPGTLELTDAARERIRELQDLSRKVEDGGGDARKELRRAVRESSPEVIARCSNIARTYRGFLAQTASGKDPLVEEAFVRRAEMLALEIAGEQPTPLERVYWRSAWRVYGASWSSKKPSYPRTTAVRLRASLPPTSYRWQSCRRA
jgi:hypothetical protein